MQLAVRHWFILQVLLGFSALTLTGAIPPAEQLLPPDTVAFFSAPDITKAITFVESSNYGRLWQDPEMRPFREKTMTRLREGFLEPIEKQLGLKFLDYKGLFQGQLTFAITPGLPGSNTFGYILLLDSREQASQLQTNLAILKKKWIDSGQQTKTEKIRDVEFTSLFFTGEDLDNFLEKSFPDPDTKVKKAPTPERKNKKFEIRIGQSDSLLLVGTNPGDLERILARKSGGTASPLAEEALYQSSHAALFRDAVAFVWVNFKPILAEWMRMAGNNLPKPKVGGLFVFRADRALTAAGLAGLRTVSLKLSNLDQGRFIEAFLDVPDSDRKGLLKLFAPDPADASPPPFVPSDATKMRRWRLDGPQAWSQLESMVLGVAPEMAGLLQIAVETVGKDKDPNFDFRKSFIANLGNDFISYQKPPRSLKPEDVDNPPIIYLIGSPRAEQLASAFKATTSLMPPPMSSGVIKEREFVGKRIFSVPLDGIDVKAGALSFAAHAGYLAITTDTALLEEFLRSAEATNRKSLESPALKEAAQKVGGFGTGLFGYENQSESMRTTIEGLKGDRGGLDKLLAAGGAAGNKLKAQETELFDLSLLPPFERISKYFGISVFSGSATARGISVKLYVPAPAGPLK